MQVIIYLRYQSHGVQSWLYTVVGEIGNHWNWVYIETKESITLITDQKFELPVLLSSKRAMLLRKSVLFKNI